jgi:beta-N-acetylhexosaminidase
VPKPRGRSVALTAAGFLLLASCATTRPSSSLPSVSSLSLDEEIGQLFVFASTAKYMSSDSPEYRELERQVRDNHVGGILWFEMTNGVYEAAFLNRRLQALASVPLLVAGDLEAGLGMRFRDATYWPWPMAVAATGDPSLAEREGRVVAEEARALGFNQIYAPVADVNSEPDNPVINTRSFGEDPADVARYVAAFVRGVQSAGVLATAKHFPGHGDTRIDSHRALPVLAADAELLRSRELVPFRAAIDAGVACVMTAHVSVPAVDATATPVRTGDASPNPYTTDRAAADPAGTLPASLSNRVVDGLLRGELGFRGLVITDALDMGGISAHFDTGEAAVRAILAGADMLPKVGNLDAAIAGVKSAVASGRIPKARVDAAVERILAAKARAHAAGEPPPDPDRIFREVESAAHRALVEEIARRSITLVREEPGVLPLSRAKRIAHVTVTDGSRHADEAVEELRRRLAQPPASFVLDPASTEADVATTLAGVASADAAVVSLIARFQTGRGWIGIPASTREALDRVLAAKPSAIVVMLGSPYVLRDAARARTMVAAWGSQTDEQVAAVRALFGEAPIGGKLPVTIPGIARRGDGIARP